MNINCSFIWPKVYDVCKYLRKGKYLLTKVVFLAVCVVLFPLLPLYCDACTDYRFITKC